MTAEPRRASGSCDLAGRPKLPKQMKELSRGGCKPSKWDRVRDMWRLSGGRRYVATVQTPLDNVSLGYSWFTFLGHRPHMHLAAWLQLIIERSTSPLSGFLQQGQQTFSKRTDSKYLKLRRLDGLFITIQLCHSSTKAAISNLERNGCVVFQ